MPASGRSAKLPASSVFLPSIWQTLALRKGLNRRACLWCALKKRGPRKSQRAKRFEIFGGEEQQAHEGSAASYARRLVHENLIALRFSVSIWFYNNQLRVRKPRFSESATQFGNPLPYGKGESDAHVYGVPLKNGVPENRNKQSAVRFLGKRSNKRTRAWQQAMRAACSPSPCCDET